MFPTARGTLHTGSPLRRVLDTQCAELELPRITTHGLRRTWNNLARQLADRMVVRAIVGHTAEAMTEHYSHISLNEKRTATEAATRLVVVPTMAETRGGNPAAAAAGDTKNP